MKRLLHNLGLTLIIILINACSLSSRIETPTQLVSEPVSTLIPPVASDTPDLPKQLIFIDRSEGWDSIRDELSMTVEMLAEEQGWQFKSLPGNPDQKVFEHAALIVVFGGNEDLSGLIPANPEAMFVFVGVSGITPVDRVAIIGSEGMRPDQIAFLSGYTAALTAPDWRIGVIGDGSTAEGQAALKSFVNGGIFFCGLCRPSYPPFQVYPASISVTAHDGDSIEMGLGQLRDLGVTTIAMTPGISSEIVEIAIKGTGSDRLMWIGLNPPGVEARGQWIATIRPDPASILNDIFKRLSEGEVDISVPMPLAVLDVNDAILTEGKLRLVLQTKDELVLGTIDTGVDPNTGLER